MLLIVPRAVDVEAELKRARAIVSPGGLRRLRCLINGVDFEVRRRDSLEAVRRSYAKAAR